MRSSQAVRLLQRRKHKKKGATPGITWLFCSPVASIAFQNLHFLLRNLPCIPSTVPSSGPLPDIKTMGLILRDQFHQRHRHDHETYAKDKADRRNSRLHGNEVNVTAMKAASWDQELQSKREPEIFGSGPRLCLVWDFIRLW